MTGSYPTVSNKFSTKRVFIFANGAKNTLTHFLETRKIPPHQKVFWIGYLNASDDDVPVLGSLEYPAIAITPSSTLEEILISVSYIDKIDLLMICIRYKRVQTTGKTNAKKIKYVNMIS